MLYNNLWQAMINCSQNTSQFGIAQVAPAQLSRKTHAAARDFEACWRSKFRLCGKNLGTGHFFNAQDTPTIVYTA